MREYTSIWEFRIKKVSEDGKIIDKEKNSDINKFSDIEEAFKNLKLIKEINPNEHFAIMAELIHLG